MLSSASKRNDNDQDDGVIINWCPSSITFHQVSKQYPVTLWRKLTSSVPRRPYALQNVTFHLFHDDDGDDDDETKHTSNTIPRSIVLLVGASSSGKSTVLKLIQGVESPDDGTVRIQSTGASSSSSSLKATPILLDDREPLTSSSTRTTTIGDMLRGCMESLVPDCYVVHSSNIDVGSLTEQILDQLSAVMNLSLNQSIASVSPSEYYRTRLAKACLQSSLMQLPKFTTPNAVVDDDERPVVTVNLPGPVLLLDEWLDKETGTVIQNVMSPSCRTRLVNELGGIVICVTHKPSLFSPSSTGRDQQQQQQQQQQQMTTTIALSGGKILSID
jgi:energy-coupling factor transporter ATP-binding protein EcfA2